MSKLVDDIAIYLRTGDLRGLSIVAKRDELRARKNGLGEGPPLTENEALTLRMLDDLLSSEPTWRIDRVSGQ